MKKLTNEEVINKLKLIYKDSLDYSKVLYINSRNPITLICPTHEDFLQYANNALQGKGGCPKCKLKISSLEEFITTAKKIFGDKFIYNKTDFKNLSLKVIITCPIHGDFEVTPLHFLHSKYGCAKCYNAARTKENKPLKLNKEELLLNKQTEWINYCNKIHKNKYNYNKVNYVYSKLKVCIICPEHGEFWQSPNDHKLGRGCPKCGRSVAINKTMTSQEEFERRANEKWNYAYKYGRYEGAHKYVEIICSKHGAFYTTAHNHLKGCGCPSCSRSYGETFILEFLRLHLILFIPQYQISISKTINPSGKAYIDFYLPDYNTFIEYNGILHYIPVEHFGGELKFLQLKLRDLYIRTYCKNNNISIIEFSYNLNTEQIINKLKTLIKNGQIQEKTS